MLDYPSELDLLLINPPFHRRWGSGVQFPLGLGYLYSYATQHGYQVGIIDCVDIISSCHNTDLEYLSQRLSVILKGLDIRLLVGVGPCLTTHALALKRIVDSCRLCLPNIPIVCGGSLASVPGQEWFFFDYLKADAIVKGDGEHAIVKLLDCLSRNIDINSIETISTSRRRNSPFNVITNLDLLPIPNREFKNNNFFSIRRIGDSNYKKTASMMTSRGCLYNCSYCVSGSLGQGRYQRRSIKSIFDEIKFLNSKFNVNDIVFYDDCLFSNIKTINQDIEYFCNELVSFNFIINWQMELRIDLLSAINKKTFTLLEKSGCRQINIGIEKTDPVLLQAIGKKIKGTIHPAIVSNIKEIVPTIRFAGTIILGGPKETKDDMWRIVYESLEMGFDYIHYNPLFVYPGTKLYKRYFSHKKDWLTYILCDNLPWGEIVFENTHYTRDDVLGIVQMAYKLFYNKLWIKNNHLDANTSEAIPIEIERMIDDRFNLS